ncbi:MAG TPA: rhodanese-like domain-containing protein [Novimethylophilus sp.]|uniref:rhodanese-like domain-containing protein n=1 Tax=Novimethylophilus sp. TaxID=2137426 RepID=UPI002F3F886D
MKFLMDNVWLIGLALGSGGMLLWPVLRRMMFGIGEVGPSEAVALINREQALVLDVRENAEYAAGHIVAAKHIPLPQLAARLAELEKWKEKPVIVNCQSEMRSAGASSLLRSNGFARVFNLGGGFAAWQAAKLPVSKE